MSTKPFDLVAAKNGARVMTRDGQPARIICWNLLGEYPVVAAVFYEDKDGNFEAVYQFRQDGGYRLSKGSYQGDLLMAVDEQGNYIYDWHKGYANMFGQRKLGVLYDTREEAVSHKTKDSIITARVIWEELK